MIKCFGIIVSFILTSTSLSTSPRVTFKEEQLKYSRVRTAYSEQEASVKSLFAEAGVDFPSCELLIRGFKKEKVLQVWGKSKPDTKYKLIKSYDFCMLSGAVGPKRRQGDLQVPEGFYHIDRFNPSSNFYLSLGINYPNSSDKIMSKHSNLGGDIFIHGDCVTIGCIPITTPLIKELYVMCVEAKSSGQSIIPVHIFPAQLSGSGWESLKSQFKDEPKLVEFWENLKVGYTLFETSSTLPKISISNSGDYVFN